MPQNPGSLKLISKHDNQTCEDGKQKHYKYATEMLVPENFPNSLPQMPPTTDSRQDEGEDSTPSSTQDREKPSIRTDQLIKLKQAKQKGRGIRRLVTLCGTITQLMVENNNRSADGEANDDVDNGNSPERKEEIRRYASCMWLTPTCTELHHARGISLLAFRRRNRNYQSYLQLIKLIPSLKPRVGTDPNELDSYAKLYYAQVSRHLYFH